MENHEDNFVFNLRMDEYVSIDTYKERGGYSALKSLLSKGTKEEALNEIKNSELRGRGGAAFPVGIKIQSVTDNQERERYIICNADEGEPGTFKDKFIMTHMPFQLLEGIVIAAYLAGASKGYIYVRHEYPEVQRILRNSIEQARAEGLIGADILGSSFDLELKIFSGAGSYLCGEETALISSIEGKKGRPRLKPPYPTS